MRALRISLIVLLLTTVLAAVALTATLAWLVKTEKGSRWVLERALDLAPVSIELTGISGTLAEGLGAEHLLITLPVVEISATDIVVSWSPASLLAGVVDIDNAYIGELGIDILETDSKGEPIDDRLFWLQIPVQIAIASGRLDALRIEDTEFSDIDLAGSIGRGRLDIEKLAAHIAGVDLQASGELAGPAPGRLQADASWAMREQNLGGKGSFNGDIEKLGFSQVINVPETVTFNGTLRDLFEAPSLTGTAEWQSIRVPGETALHINAGRFGVSSDFRVARFSGDGVALLEGWPEAPVQLEARIDTKGFIIDAYALDALDGHITGTGEFAFAEGLQGRVAIEAAQINTALVNSDLPGHLGFSAMLHIESPAAFTVDVSAAQARIAEREISGSGQVRLRDSRLNAIKARVDAGNNRLTADIKMDRKLAGVIDAKAPELAMLWPGLAGVLDASARLGGTPERPQVRVHARASSVSFGEQSLDALTLSAELHDSDRLTGKLSVTGLAAGELAFGNLDYSLNGTLAEHRSALALQGGIVDVDLRATGGWDGERFAQRFDYGRVQPDGFDSWQLEQKPELRVSATGGQVSAHCWTQLDASLCVDASSWDADSLNAALGVDRFGLASLQPLLAEGYSIDGTVDAEMKITRNTQGLQAQIRWRQSRTTLGYADDIDTFQTVIDRVHIELSSDNTTTSLAADLSGDLGLNMSATAEVNGPLHEASPLQASARGRLPDIGLLRPLLQRVANPGELEGDLTIDLKADGTLGDPLFKGGAKLADGLLGLPGAGVTLSAINITAQSRGTDRLTVTGELRSGDGKASVQGEIRAAEDTDIVADIRIRGQNLATVRVPDLSVDTSPDLKLFIGEGVFDITGTLLIPHASAQIRSLPQSAVPRSPDVIVHAPERDPELRPETLVTGNVEVVLGDDVRFNGFGLDSRLDGGLRLTQSRGGDLRTGGTVRVREGFLTGYGKELRVDRGELTFTGPLDDPLVNIQVSRETIYESRVYIIGLRLTGTAQNIKTEPFSRPAMSERDVLSFLLLDRPATSDSDASGAALALGLQQLLPDQSGLFGLDEVSFETNDANEAAMVAGKRINEDLTVRYVFGSVGTPGSFRIRYRLGRGFSLEASTGARQSMDLIYLLER